MGHRIILANSEDWEGLYLNDLLQFEGHKISVLEALEFVSDLGDFDVEPQWIAYEWMQEQGNLPLNFNDIPPEVIDK
jgi:hypothetical protein